MVQKKKKNHTAKKVKRIIRDSFLRFCWNVTLVIECDNKILMYEFMADRVFPTKEAAEGWMSFSCPPYEKYAEFFTDENGSEPIKVKWVPERYQYLLAPAGKYRDSELGTLLRKKKP